MKNSCGPAMKISRSKSVFFVIKPAMLMLIDILNTVLDLPPSCPTQPGHPQQIW